MDESTNAQNEEDEIPFLKIPEVTDNTNAFTEENIRLFEEITRSKYPKVRIEILPVFRAYFEESPETQNVIEDIKTSKSETNLFLDQKANSDKIIVASKSLLPANPRAHLKRAATPKHSMEEPSYCYTKKQRK